MGSGSGFLQSWLRRETLAIPEHLIIANSLPSTALQRSLPQRRSTLTRCPVLAGAGRRFGAAGFMAVADPRVLFGASFELTFLCVSLVAERTLEPIRRGLRYLDSTGYDYALAPKIVQFRLDLRMIAGRIGNFLGRRISLPLLALAARVIIGTCELLAISLVMQVGLALPMAYYFHRATVVALPANMLA